MSSVVQAQPVSSETLELVLAKGDLSQLTAQQRLQYYTQVCKTLGINPLTRPFRFLNFQGQTLMYATKDCTDQLRAVRKVNVRIVDKTLDGDLFMVTAQAKLPDGRSDEDVGAVSLNRLYGDQKANAIMKALTKAKRRVTLSLCGLGMLDESELETMNGVQTFDVEDAPPAPMPRVEQEPPPAGGREAINQELPLGEKPRTRRQFLDNLEISLQAAQTQEDFNLIDQSRDVQNAKKSFEGKQLNELWALLSTHKERIWNAPAEITPEDRFEA